MLKHRAAQTCQQFAHIFRNDGYCISIRVRWVMEFLTLGYKINKISSLEGKFYVLETDMVLGSPNVKKF